MSNKFDKVDNPAEKNEETLQYGKLVILSPEVEESFRHMSDKDLEAFSWMLAHGQQKVIVEQLKKLTLSREDDETLV